MSARSGGAADIPALSCRMAFEASEDGRVSRSESGVSPDALRGPRSTVACLGMMGFDQIDSIIDVPTGGKSRFFPEINSTLCWAPFKGKGPICT